MDANTAGAPNVAELRSQARANLGPDVAIALRVRSKTPGEAMVGREVELLATEGIRRRTSTNPEPGDRRKPSD